MYLILNRLQSWPVALRSSQELQPLVLTTGDEGDLQIKEHVHFNMWLIIVFQP